MTTEAERHTAWVSLPDDFFSVLLPRVNNLPELKLTLHVIEMCGKLGIRSVAASDLEVPRILHSVVGVDSPRPAEVRLRDVINRAVANGTLIHLGVRTAGGVVSRLLPATAGNRAFVDALGQDGDMPSELESTVDGEVVVYRPNIFAVYEQHIGPLTPLVAESIRDAERSYPSRWIEDAILAAVQYNKRHWRYVEAILARWEEIGGPHGGVGRRS